MRRMLTIAAIATLQATLLAASGLGAQGPGVGPGSASAFQQFGAALIVAGLGAFLVVGLVVMLLGSLFQPERSRDT